MQTFVPREEFDILLEILWESDLRQKMKERLLFPPKERQRLVKVMQAQARKEAANAPAPPFKEEEG